VLITSLQLLTASLFRPPHALKQEERGYAAVCQRCYSLRHHGVVTPLKIPYEEVKEHLKLIANQSCLVVKIVDIFDFSGSFINDFRGITGNNPIMLVGNKVPWPSLSCDHACSVSGQPRRFSLFL
jgi:hypothetical protein